MSDLGNKEIELCFCKLEKTLLQIRCQQIGASQRRIFHLNLLLILDKDDIQTKA